MTPIPAPMGKPLNEPRLVEYQLTKDEAIELANRGTLNDMPAREAALFQLRQERLCCDFSHFHKGMGELLDRPVWTHEFARPDDLWAEYLGVIDKPDFAAIVAKLPERLRDNIIVVKS